MLGAQCALRRLTRRGTNGASMAPSLATVLLVPTPILRIAVGYSSAVYTTMTPNDDVIPSLPIRNSSTTAQFRSVGRKSNRSHTAHMSIAHISRFNSSVTLIVVLFNFTYIHNLLLKRRYSRYSICRIYPQSFTSSPHL